MSTLYHHKTDGGAEYLCASPIEGTNEGDLHTAIVRLDGEPELLNPVYVAAPELLDALKAMSDAFDIGQRATYNSAIGKCRAAIRKAEGE